MAGGLLWGPGSITEAQLVAFSCTAIVLLFLLTVNVVVWRLYRRASGEDRRKAKKLQKKKMSDVWVYHVHRTNQNPSRQSRDSASQQILNKLRASHENLRASIQAQADQEGLGTLGQEECQALEELEIAADLFLHDTSYSSSRRSSLGSGRGSTVDSYSHQHQRNEVSSVTDFDVDSTLRELDAATDFGDLDASSALDKVSMSSVTLADFENDPAELQGAGGRGKKIGRRRSKRKSGGGGGGGHDNKDQVLPVAEFHNEAFDFAEPGFTAVERVKDVEL